MLETTSKTATKVAIRTFHPFSHLPPELRCQIWRNSLCDQDRPALRPYKKGCWRRRYLTPSDERYHHSAEWDSNLTLDFRPDLELYVEVPIPLVFVSHEARSVALGWAREQSVRMHFDEERKCHVFTRPFILTRDILYLPQQRIPDLIDEPWNMLEPEESAWYDLGLIRLAVSMDTLLTSRDLLGLWEIFRSPSELLVIVSPTPELDDEKGMSQGHWELEGCPGESDLIDKRLKARLEEARTTFRPPFLDDNEGVWGIRPICVVRT